MKRSLGGAAVATLALCSIPGSRLAGQTPAPVSLAAKGSAAWAVPRTVDGHPDIEGVWNHGTLTPLQRSEQFAGRPFMSDDEAARFEKETLQTVNGDRRGGIAAADLGGAAVNEFWLERGPLAIVNGRKPTSLIVDPADGRLPPLTPAAEARAAARARSRRFDGPEDLSLSERCLRSASGPPIMAGAPDANVIRIVQSRGHVAIVQEKNHETRFVILDGRPHVSAKIRSWMGDSRGRWEGNTLVVDTTNFTSQLALGARYDENLHLVERFTRVGPNTLLYEFTVDDPTTFTRPWTVVYPMRRTGEELYEFACHEGNYSLPGMLRVARFGDQADRNAQNPAR